MPLKEIIDTFPAFLAWFDKSQHLPLKEQVESWAKEYLAPWPELFRKQSENYTLENLDWRQIACKKVFPRLKERLPGMQEARKNLLMSCSDIYNRTREILGFDSDVTFVIYVGIGCGAGWATQFQGRPAVLLGLENIAECGWAAPEAIRGLIAHELGHLVHYHWRGQTVKNSVANPWQQLYEEGFAQHCEGIITGNNVPHQQLNNKNSGWLNWCGQNKGLLAAEFLKRVDHGESISAFFGSWYKIMGKSETGYYLGHEIIRELEAKLSIHDIARLDNVALYLKPILTQMAGLSG